MKLTNVPHLAWLLDTMIRDYKHPTTNLQCYINKLSAEKSYPFTGM